MKRIRTVRNLKGEVYKIVRAGIADRTLSPGARLTETDLVKRLGVSRTPIREALNQLAKEGMVEIIPRKGTFVKHHNPEEVVEIIALREVLEGLAARLAAVRLTEADIDAMEAGLERYHSGEMTYSKVDRLFHDRIVTASGMPRLHTLINNLYDSLQMTNVLAAAYKTPGRIEESLAEHRGILEAFRQRDPHLAEKRSRQHLQATLSFFLQLPDGQDLDEFESILGGKRDA